MRETSVEALRSIDAESLRELVFEFISGKDEGATCEEVEQALTIKHQTASARIWELHKGQRIKDSGLRRNTMSGRKAIVWAETH